MTGVEIFIWTVLGAILFLTLLGLRADRKQLESLESRTHRVEVGVVELAKAIDEDRGGGFLKSLDKTRGKA